jgi:hypothetical protein
MHWFRLKKQIAANKAPVVNGILYFGITVYLLYYFTFTYPFSFNFETELNGQYTLAYLFPLFTLIILVGILQKSIVISWRSLFAYLILLCFFSLICFTPRYSFPNEHFLFTATVIILSATAVLFSQQLPFRLIILTFVLLFLYQLETGLVQYIDAAGLENVSLLIKGDLQNSGIYACWLVIQLPFVYYSLFHLSFKQAIQPQAKPGVLFFIKAGFFALLLAMVSFLVYQTQSRSAFIALMAFLFTYCVQQWGHVIRKKITTLSKPSLSVITLIGLTLVAFGAYYLFYLKKLSAIGRLMRCQVAWEHISDHFWLGTGLGRFTWYYPQWQVQYFQTHTNPPTDFFLSAGETYIIFNEYLQLFKEIGFIGFLVFVIALIYFFKSKSASHKQLLNAVKATVITILACGFTSYPLHVTPFLLLFAFCFALAVTIRENPMPANKYFSFNKKPVFKPLLFLLFLLSGYTSYEGLRQVGAAQEWNDLREKYSLTPEQTKDRYNNLHSTLQYDGKFLTEYGEYLLQDSTDAPVAIEILEKAKTCFISKKTIQALGSAYLRTNNYSKAIENLEWLSYYVPNRFGAKYELLKLYKQSGNLAKTRQIANIILTMPVKIPSYEVSEIKENTRQVLKALNVQEQ